MKLMDEMPSVGHAQRNIQARWGFDASVIGASAKPRKRTAKSVRVAPTKLLVTGLFAGVGGFEEGFRQAGHTATLLCEFDPLARAIFSGLMMNRSD
jgi:hypothetical protein